MALLLTGSRDHFHLRRHGRGEDWNEIRSMPEPIGTLKGVSAKPSFPSPRGFIIDSFARLAEI
ncbi:MAG: hypothetical protein WA733_03065 [Methylocystis sp.]